MGDEKRPATISEHILEVRYKPNPEFLDYRGSYTKGISNLLSLNHWKIDNNRVDIYNDDNSLRAFISFRNFGLIIQNSYDKNYFPNQANKFVRYILSQKTFKNPPFITRLGVRSRFAFPSTTDFDTLLENYISKYFSLSEKAKGIFKDKVVDAGLPIYFQTEIGQINTQSGPMNKDQLVEFFPNTPNLPDVALYIDLDYWKEPKKDLSEDNITHLIKEYSINSWNFYEQITSLISE